MENTAVRLCLACADSILRQSFLIYWPVVTGNQRITVIMASAYEAVATVFPNPLRNLTSKILSFSGWFLQCPACRMALPWNTVNTHKLNLACIYLKYGW